MFENYKDCLFNKKIILQSDQGFKSEHHDVYTVETNKKVLSSNDDKRLQTFNKNKNAFKVCESEMLLIIDYYKHENEDEVMFGICQNKHTKITQNKTPSFK